MFQKINIFMYRLFRAAGLFAGRKRWYLSSYFYHQKHVQNHVTMCSANMHLFSTCVHASGDKSERTTSALKSSCNYTFLSISSLTFLPAKGPTAQTTSEVSFYSACCLVEVTRGNVPDAKHSFLPAALKKPKTTGASIILKWKKFGTTKTLPRGGA